MIHDSNFFTFFHSTLPICHLHVFQKKINLYACNPAPKVIYCGVSPSFTKPKRNDSSLGQGAAFNVTLLWWVRVLFPTWIFVHQSLENPGLVGMDGWDGWINDNWFGRFWNQWWMGRTLLLDCLFFGEIVFCSGWKIRRCNKWCDLWFGCSDFGSKLLKTDGRVGHTLATLDPSSLMRHYMSHPGCYHVTGWRDWKTS